MSRRMISRYSLPQKLLLFLVLFHIIGNIVWITMNHAPPTWDEANHTRYAIEYARFFSGLLQGHVDLDRFVRAYSDPYGPLLRIVTGGVMAVFGMSVQVSQIVSTIIFALCIVAVYRLISQLMTREGSHTLHGQWVSLLVTAIFAGSELVYAHSRWLLLDIGVTLFSLLSLTALIQSDMLNVRKYAIWCGVWAACTLLTKVQAFVYFLFPAIYVLIALYRHEEDRKKKVMNGLVGMAICSGLVCIWLLPNLTTIWYYVRSGTTIKLGHPDAYASLLTWTFYPKIIINNLLGLPLTLLLLIGSVASVWTRWRYKYFVWGMVVFYYVGFTLISNKDPRFYYPLIPFVALLGVRGLIEMRKIPHMRLVLLFVTGVILSWKILLYFTLSFGGPLPRTIEWFVMPVEGIDITIANTKSLYPVSPYVSEVWGYERMMRDLKEIAKGNNGHEVTIFSLANFEHINANVLSMYASLYGVERVRFTSGVEKTKLDSEKEIVAFVKRDTYTLYTEGTFGPPFQWDREVYEQAQKKITEKLAIGDAIRVKSYTFPSAGIYEPIPGQVITLVQILK